MSETRKPTDEQPAPVPERPDLPVVWDLVLEDVLQRYRPPACFMLDEQKVYVNVLRLAQGLAATLGSDVIADMRERDATGRARYGTPLQPHNGREALKDAYQELLDAAVYLRQHLYERDGR